MKFILCLLISFASFSLNAVDEFPVEHFFKDPSMLSPQLSPDGKYLAALLPYNINEETQKVCKRRTQNILKDLEKYAAKELGLKKVDVSTLSPEFIKDLKRKYAQAEEGVHFCDLSRRNVAVIWLADPNPNCQQGNYALCQRMRVTQLRSQNVSGFRWVNNERIVFQTGGDELNDMTGFIDTIGIYAVNKDGTKAKQLVEPGDAMTNHKIISTYSLHRLPEDPEHILVMRNDRKRYYLDVYRMNVYTGKFFRVLVQPGPVTAWGVDNNGVVRMATMQDENSLAYETQIMYRDNEDSEWREVDRFEGMQNGWTSLGFTEDNKKIYVTSNLGRDTFALSLFDPATGELEDLFENEGTDVTRIGMTDDGEVITIVYNDLDTKPKRHFLNDKWKNILENLSTAFGVDYVGIASMSDDQQKMILSIGDDRNPGDYYLYDRNKNQIAYLGSTRPWIDPKTMAEMKPIEFEARDGETIHGFLSVPVGSDGKNLPLIVNPHGGPFGIHDQWGFNPETQFFVNRGYAVMQVNFRGSGGYGKRHERIGYKRWGLEMQDDISDGVNWAVEQGIADRDHVCIYGASYGGYATMAGITLTPELYRCAVNYVGIWDIKMLYEQNGRWVDRAKRWFHNHVLDPKEDVDQLRKTSPNFHLDNIQAPLLIVHGRRDYNVRIEQAETLMNALDKKNIPYEVLIKKEEGHGFRLEENKVELYTVMEKFFEKNLSKPNQRND